MIKSDLISKTITLLKQNSEKCRKQWLVSYRDVYGAILISSKVLQEQLVVQISALLHDIADSKFHDAWWNHKMFAREF
jgi:uncharacterized protein